MSFYRYTGDKMKTRENVSLFQKGTEDSVKQNMEEAEVFNNFFTLVFTNKCSSHTTPVTEGKSRGWESEKLPTVEEDQVQDYLKNLKMHRSTGAEGTGE